MDKLFDSALIGEVFDTEQKDVLIKLGQNVGKYVDEKSEKAVMDALEKRGIDSEVLGLSDTERAALKLKNRVKNVRKVWDNNGWVTGVRDRITYQDLCAKDLKFRDEWTKSGKMVDGVFSTDQPMAIPRVIEQLVRETVEPTLVLTPLLQTVNVSNAGTVISFPAIGDAMVAADIPEAGEYPEGSIEMAGEVTAKIGKSGIAVKISEEMVRYSMFDIMSIHLRAASRALARHKEQKIANMILVDNGTTFFNGTTGGFALSGRDSAGALNGTITLDDILLMYADMANDGFIPDTLIMHPFSWFGMAREPVLRSIFMKGLGQGSYMQTFQGTVGSPGGGFNGGGLNTKNYFDDPTQLQTTYTVPGILPTPLSVIVTPYQTVDVGAGTATITLCKRSELGLLLVDEQPTTEEWHDPARDIMKVKIRERYALATSSNGRAIKHAKAVNWRAKGYAFDDLLTWQAGTGALTPANQPNLGNNTV